jgi:hypothetical protein
MSSRGRTVKSVLDCLTCPASFLCVNGWCLHIYACFNCDKLFDVDVSVDEGDHYSPVGGDMNLKDVPQELLDAVINCAKWFHGGSLVYGSPRILHNLDTCDDCEPDGARYRE